MRSMQLFTLSLLAAVSVGGAARARTFVSVGVGVGPYWGGYYRPWGYYGPYWAPYPYYYGYYPPPVVVAPAAGPVVVPAPSPAPAYPAPAPTQPASAPVSTAPAGGSYGSSAAQQHLQLLTNPDEKVRQNAVLELGRMKADNAVDPLTAVLARDSSPAVREAAARALGLIADPRSLPALIRAAQADNDRDVRHSAQFAVEIIRSNLRRQ
jgi:hypothetical protein